MKYYQTFVADGALRFPVDMLRYDRCFPHDQDSTAELIEAIDGTGTRPYHVRLGRFARSKEDLPRFDRWSSFVWSVDPKSITWTKLV